MLQLNPPIEFHRIDNRIRTLAAGGQQRIRYDRIPIRVKTAQSNAFIQNDPFLKLSVDEMNYRKFNIPAPGGTEIQTLHNAMVNDAMSGKRAVRDALADGARQMQQVLDKWKR